MIDDPRLPPPALAALVQGNTVELTWQARDTRHDAFIVWTPSSCLWAGPGSSTAAITLPSGTHSLAIRSVGPSSIGAWSDAIVVQIGDAQTDFALPPAAWIVASDETGSWFVVGPGVWGGVVFYSLADAQAFATFRAAHPGDANNDGHVNSQDFFDIFAALLIASPSADWNGDGLITTSDLFDFLIDFSHA